MSCAACFRRNTRLLLCLGNSSICRSTLELESAVKPPLSPKALLAWAKGFPRSTASVIRNSGDSRISSLLVRLRKEKEKSKKGRGHYDKDRKESDHPRGAMARGGPLPQRAFLPQLQIKETKKSFRILFNRFGFANISVHHGK